jgi:hypothetical protein
MPDNSDVTDSSALAADSSGPSSFSEGPSSTETTAGAETTSRVDTEQSADPFSREGAFQVPWDEIEGGTGEAAPAPPGGEASATQEAESVAAPGEGPPGAEAENAVKPDEELAADEKQTEPDLASRVDQLGGTQVLDMVAPLFEPVRDIGEAVQRAGAFIDRVGQYDPAIKNGLVNALFEKFKPTLTIWADQERGLTPESLAEFNEWKETGGVTGARVAAPGFPEADENGLVHFEDGLELDLDQPIHREIYAFRRDRFERAENERVAAARAEDERTRTLEQAREQRIADFQSARVSAFDKAWDEAKPDYGPDPELQFLTDFAKVYAQYKAGSSSEAQALFSEGARVAADGGLAAEAKAAKLDLLARHAIKDALETIDRLVQRAAARQTAAAVGQPKLPPGAVRTGVVHQGTGTAPAQVRPNGKFSLDDPESFAAIRIPS